LLGELLRHDPRAAEVLRLRFYAGLKVADVAQLLGVSSRTVNRDWLFARAWLHERLADDAGVAGPGGAGR